MKLLTGHNADRKMTMEEYLLTLHKENYHIISDNITIPMPDELHPEDFPLDIAKVVKDQEEVEHVYSLLHLSEWNELVKFVKNIGIGMVQ